MLCIPPEAATNPRLFYPDLPQLSHWGYTGIHTPTLSPEDLLAKTLPTDQPVCLASLMEAVPH